MASDYMPPQFDQFAILRQCRRALSPGSTNCRGTVKRWHYNSTSQVCRPFSWSGCAGNDNRFDTREDCETRCHGVQRNNEIQLYHSSLIVYPFSLQTKSTASNTRWL